MTRLSHEVCAYHAAVRITVWTQVCPTATTWLVSTGYCTIGNRDPIPNRHTEVWPVTLLHWTHLTDQVFYLPSNGLDFSLQKAISRIMAFYL
mmetsp:Transcript_40988/g.68517  ORF Transcript_40988/g.68517 Transcript_40988/m.68517 type:complete len:92 (+) Transcript_40988:3-278(+)